MSSLYDAMLDSLAAPLDSVVEPGARIRAGAVVEQWDLPEPDRLALRRFGLPDGPLLRPAPQAEASPVLTPNVAGDRERGLISTDQSL